MEAAQVTQSLHEFLCATHDHYRAAWDASVGKRYADLLAEIAPMTPRPFLEELLGLLLRKPA
jgi:hypothetical protein